MFFFFLIFLFGVVCTGGLDTRFDTRCVMYTCGCCCLGGWGEDLGGSLLFRPQAFAIWRPPIATPPVPWSKTVVSLFFSGDPIGCIQLMLILVKGVSTLGGRKFLSTLYEGAFTMQ